VHVRVSVTITVSDVVTTSRIHSRDCSRVPPAVTTVIAHNSLVRPVSLYRVGVSGRDWSDGGGVEDFLVTVIVLYLVPSSDQSRPETPTRYRLTGRTSELWAITVVTAGGTREQSRE
jgi:hypothetical protein